jgi:CRAL/TRIO domain
LVRPGAFNPHKYRNYDMIKIHGIVYETLMEDEENQGKLTEILESFFFIDNSLLVNGFVHIIDSSNMSLAHLTLFTPKEAYKIGKNLEKLLPMRHKQIHGLKVLPSIKFAVDFALSKMTPKMKQRVFLHQKIEDVTVDKNLLPKEYGGEVPMQEMIDAFVKEVEAKRETLLNNDNMSVHLHLYPQDVREGSVKSLNKSIEKMSPENEKMDFLGVQGSFRKLEID